jgi:hypothetical protein
LRRVLRGAREPLQSLGNGDSIRDYDDLSK